MQLVLDAIDKIKLPKVIFQMTAATQSSISFECEGNLEFLEGDDELTTLINAAAKQNVRFRHKDNQVRYFIDREAIIEYVNRAVRESHIKLWMLVEKKIEFRRTKFYKDLKYAKSDKFKKISLELFLDAAKYGIKMNALDKHTEIKPIHKFIAAKFQASAEAECPR